MIHYVFTVYDSKAEAFLPPFFLHTKGLAIRSFINAATDERHEFYRHPGDYTLFCIGRWDDNSGAMEPRQNFENLGTALTVRRSVDRAAETAESQANGSLQFDLEDSIKGVADNG